MATSDVESFGQSAYEAFRKHSAELLTAIQDPEVLAWQLFAKNIISPVLRDDAANTMVSTVVRTSKLLVAVEGQIVVNPEAFAAFLSVLDDKRPGMNDLCKRMRDAYLFAGSDLEQLNKTVFAYENRQAINEKFADFLTNVRDKLLENRVNIEKFQPFVAALFPPGDCIPRLPTDLTKVFEAITHHGLWDCFHYSPLVQIVRKFGANDPQMEAWIEKYMKDLKAYTIVADCVESNSAKYDPRYNTPVEWKTNFVDHSLQHLTNVWEMFSAQYLGPDSPPTALLDRVRKGCMLVTWIVPSYLIPQLIERVEVDTEFFQRNRILRVTVRDKVVYEEEEPEGTIDELEPASKKPNGGGTYEGYDCDFIVQAPSVYQTSCPICHLILRDPYEATCCGYSFCYTCIQRFRRNNSTCPWCRKGKFEVRENMGMKHSLNQLGVYCTYSIDGCTWRGELGELQAHLDKTDHSVYERPTNKSPSCQQDNKSKMEWKQRESLPEAMNSHHIVRISNNVYCGGGFTGKVSTDRLVFKYDCKEDKWSQLPICPTLHFGLTQLDEKLVTVGGRDIDEFTPIKDVYIFEEDSQEWSKSNIPPLSEARCSPCAFAYNSVLVASGGINRWKFDYEHSARTNSVEVFQGSQWHASLPLPFALSAMSCAIVNDTCYIIGGSKSGGLPNRQVCFISIPSLTEHPESINEVSTSSTKWERRNCPLFFSTPAEQGGNLLAIGGKNDSNVPSSAVHKYLPSTDSWETIANGTLPKTTFHAAAISLEGGDIIIVGGRAKPGNVVNTVYIGSIQQ